MGRVNDNLSHPRFPQPPAPHGIIHPGIQNPVDSLKGKLCVEGNKLTRKICKELGVHFKETGEMRPLSMGSVRYHIHLYNLTEDSIFDHHMNVTDRLPKEMTLEEFKSLTNGKRTKKELSELKEYILKVSKTRACSILNSIADKIDYPDMCFEYYSDTDLTSFYEVLLIMLDGNKDYLNKIFSEVA